METKPFLCQDTQRKAACIVQCTLQKRSYVFFYIFFLAVFLYIEFIIYLVTTDHNINRGGGVNGRFNYF